MGALAVGVKILEVALRGFQLAFLLDDFLNFEIVDEVLAALDLGILDLAELRIKRYLFADEQGPLFGVVLEVEGQDIVQMHDIDEGVADVALVLH